MVEGAVIRARSASTWVVEGAVIRARSASTWVVEGTVIRARSASTKTKMAISLPAVWFR